jgi:hypothetical protein
MFWLAFSFKLSKNYALDFCSGNFYRRWKDGIDFVDFNIVLELYKRDHNPQFRIFFSILNLNLIDFIIYNVNHLPEVTFE